MENDDQDRMPNGNGSPLLATPGGQTSILSRQICILGPACCKGGFDQELAEAGTAFVGLATQAFARAFVISRTHPGARCQMLGTLKPIHVRTNFGQDAFGGSSTDARNATEQNHGLCQAQRLFVGLFGRLVRWTLLWLSGLVRWTLLWLSVLVPWTLLWLRWQGGTHSRFNFGPHAPNCLLQPLNVVKLFGEHEMMMRFDGSHQSSFELGSFGFECPSRQIFPPFGVGFSRRQPSQKPLGGCDRDVNSGPRS